MRTNLAVLTAVLALAGGVAACSTSATNSSSQSSATATSGGNSGTETIHGKITAAEALANNPTFHLTFTGPVNTTSTNSLGSSPTKGGSYTFKTHAGNLVVTFVNAASNTGGLTSSKTCQAAFSTSVPFNVDGSKSTGQFAGATGSGGKAVVVFSGELPRLKNGQCDQSQNAEPSQKTATATFTATTPLTLKG
jgi:hypothetical protein